MPKDPCPYGFGPDCQCDHSKDGIIRLTDEHDHPSDPLDATLATIREVNETAWSLRRISEDISAELRREPGDSRNEIIIKLHGLSKIQQKKALASAQKIVEALRAKLQSKLRKELDEQLDKLRNLK